MSSSTLLIIGSKSQIGAEVMRLFQAAGQPCAGTDRSTLDLERVSSDWRPPAGTRTAILCAAITNIHECEKDPVRSRRVNVEGTIQVLESLRTHGVRPIFISSNLVFGGQSPFQPEDLQAQPQTLYGRQKAEVEEWMRAHLTDYAVLRIAKVLMGTKTLIYDWKVALEAGQEITPFADLTFCPVTVEPIYECLRALVSSRENGMFNLSGDQEITYEQAGQTLCRMMGLPLTRVKGTPARQLGYPGPLPRYSTLATTRLAQLGIMPPSSQECLERYIRRVLQTQG